MSVDTELSAKEVLQGLKDFQKRTVEYLFSRFYGENPTKRFLVADEVGLGKTMVAKGVVAKTVEYLLQQGQERINIVYICSNAAIAEQNIKRLAIGENRFVKATRLTYLPREVKDLQSSSINFISLTPGTTFEHTRSRVGHMDERAILYHLLTPLRWAKGTKRKRYRTGLKNMLQVRVGKERWRIQVEDSKEWELDKSLAVRFRRTVEKDKELYHKLKECAWNFRRYKKNIDGRLDEKRYEVIGKLRTLLAKVCLDVLKPDLVILDEFQRFKNLIEGDEEDAGVQLAKALFNSDEDVRVLLLSATPYKMYTMYREGDEENHYEDFLLTLKFLYDDESEVENIKEYFEGYRLALIRPDSERDLKTMKMRIEQSLLKVMCRTERTGITRDNDAMLKENLQQLTLQAADLRHAAFYEKIADEIDAGSTIEYWKSAPYLLNFMKEYELKKRFVKALTYSKESPLKETVNTHRDFLLSKEKILNYRKLHIPNPNMRQLFSDTIEKGMWRLLWMPPSMPYIEPRSIYRGKEDIGKVLVFSSWNVVPDAIAALSSYEAERKMVKTYESAKSYRWYDSASRLLDFRKDRDKGDLRGMPVLSWMLPFQKLASMVDPMLLAAEEGRPLDIDEMKRLIKIQIKRLLERLPEEEDSVRVDERWYWAAPLLLEENDGLFGKWLKKMVERHSSKGSETESVIGEHLQYAMQALRKEISLGRRPDDLEDVLCDLVLAAPGICAYRSLERVCSLERTEEAGNYIFDATWKIAQGFRTLFSRPDSIAMLSGIEKWKELPYWRKTLRYGIEGNLQALLDEYVHTLRDSLGFAQRSDPECIETVSGHIHDVLSLRTANIKADTLNESLEGFDVVHIRSNFAMRFGDIRDDKGDRVLRASSVRDAFNSPFRPFVLATTSVGQEGLDFHTWCHTVIHWNLPSNPVDLEQREGRVHRYKGYAVRKNIAMDFGLKTLKEKEFSDPWVCLFESAKAKRDSGMNDLIPYWIYESGNDSFKVERRVPFLPFSKEKIRYEHLKKSLGLYRLAFGQPRQEDLISILENRTSTISTETVISLFPKTKNHSDL